MLALACACTATDEVVSADDFATAPYQPGWNYALHEYRRRCTTWYRDSVLGGIDLPKREDFMAICQRMLAIFVSTNGFDSKPGTGCLQ